MNKKLLASAIAAALGFSFAANSSMAAVNLNDSTASDPVTFAEELNLDTTTPFSLGTGCTGSLAATVPLGFGFSSSNSDMYVRYSLDKGATWGGVLTAANLTITDVGDVGTGGATISRSAGGLTADNFVIFNISSTTALSQEAVLTFTPTTIDPVIKEPVTLTYGLYTTPNAALSHTPGSELGDLKSGTFVDFAKYFALSGSKSTAIAEVTEDFLLFSGDNANPTDTHVAKIGTMNFGSSADTVYNKSLCTASATDLLPTTSTTLTITGDFSAADAIFIDTPSSSSCIPTNADFTGVIATDGASAKFTIATASVPSASATYDVCFDADGVTAMNTGQYTAAFQNASDIEVGAIRRNGVELIAPFVALNSAYVPRFYLTNTGTKAVDFTVSAQTDVAAGAPCTLNAPFSDCALTANKTLGWGIEDNVGNVGCSIGAGKSLLIKGPELFAADAAGSLIGKRCTVTFRVASDDDSVHGLYQQRTKATTDFDSYLMISIGSDSAH